LSAAIPLVPNPADGSPTTVTHFKITNITAAACSRATGVTPVINNDVITWPRAKPE